MSDLKLFCHMTCSSPSGYLLLESSSCTLSVAPDTRRKHSPVGQGSGGRRLFFRYETWCSLWLFSWSSISLVTMEVFPIPALPTHRFVLRMKRGNQCVKVLKTENNTQNYLIAIKCIFQKYSSDHVTSLLVNLGGLPITERKVSLQIRCKQWAWHLVASISWFPDSPCFLLFIYCSHHFKLLSVPLLSLSFSASVLLFMMFSYSTAAMYKRTTCNYKLDMHHPVW